MRYQVTIDNPTTYAVVDLKGGRQDLSAWPATESLIFPSSPNSFTQTGPITVCWVGPENWLLRTELENESLLAPMTCAADIPDTVSAVLFSDALAFFGVRGSDASQVLSIASPLDVHQSVFPENAVSYTEAFGLKTLVMRCRSGFELAVERSYSDMLGDYLRRAVGA